MILAFSKAVPGWKCVLKALRRQQEVQLSFPMAGIVLRMDGLWGKKEVSGTSQASRKTASHPLFQREVVREIKDKAEIWAVCWAMRCCQLADLRACRLQVEVSSLL